jgi:hypothetical protein
MSDYIDGLVLATTAKMKRSAYTDTELAALRKAAEAGAYDATAVADAVFFPVVASANTLDSYGTYMLPSTLKNFAEDATAGVAVLDSHNSRRLNFGMSVSGEYVEEKNGDSPIRYMRSDFFTIPGLATEGLNTDTYIKGVQAGLFRDVSVGFWMPPNSEIRCTICGKNMMRWWGDDACHHFAGSEYKVEANGETRMEYAYGAVDGGRLSEYSLVPDGATPGAGVAKARNMEEMGELDAETALHLERIYQTTFPRATRRFTQGVTLNTLNMPLTKGGKVMEDELHTEEGTVELTVITPMEVTPPVAEEDAEAEDRAIETSKLKFSTGLRSALNERYADIGITFGERVADAVTALADEVKRLRGEVATLTDDKRALEGDAKDGRAYRAALVEELKSEVIRSAVEGEDVEAKVARYVKLADASDVETIRGLRDDFAAIARAKFGSGRKSTDNDEAVTETKRVIPDDAYDE